MYPYSSLPKPLPPAQYYILLTLARADSYAYPLKASARNNSLGSVTIPANKLYTLLQAMHDEGLIDILGERATGKSGKHRLHYGISGYGTIRLQEESKRLKHAIEIAESIGVLENDTPTDIQRLLLDVRKLKTPPDEGGA